MKDKESINEGRAVSQIELHTGLKVLSFKLAECDADNRVVPHNVFRVALSDGAEYVAKRLNVEQVSSGALHDIAEKPRPHCQKIRYLFEDNSRGHFYALSEWINGIALEKSLERADAVGAIQKAVLSLRALHEDSRTNENVSFDKNDVVRALSKDFLSRSIRTTLCSYMLERLPIINSRVKTFVHGDMHLGNIVMTGDDDVTFIDLDDVNWGDAFTDLVYAANLIITSEQQYAYFSFIEQYFDGEPPCCFWPIVNFYSAIKAISIMEREIEFSKTKTARLPLERLVFVEHEGMRNEIPAWYRKIRSRVYSE
jgi:hypothetical protein